jgi:hypothetical protein
VKQLSTSDIAEKVDGKKSKAATVEVTLEPGQAGTSGHGGAYRTQAWIDPRAKRVYILMVQRASFPNSYASEARKGFQEAASGAFSDLNKK